LEKDAVGFPVRNAGERYQFEGRIFTIVENLGLTVLCPCPDSLRVRYEDNDEETMIENSDMFERVN